MADRKVLIVLGAVGAAGLAAFLWMRRAAAAAKVGTQMVVTTPPPASVAAGQEFTFAGYLKDVNGNRLSGKTVDLRADGAVAGSATTDASGGWSFTVALDRTAALYAEFPGDEGYAGCNI